MSITVQWVVISIGAFALLVGIEVLVLWCVMKAFGQPREFHDDRQH